jgi:hypothetical protein
VPAGFGDLYAVVLGGGFDVGEGLFALVVGDVLHLIEAGDGVADVGGVVERLLALVGEGVNGCGKVVSLLCIECLVVFVVLPGCFHDELQSCFQIAPACSVLRKLGCDLGARCCEGKRFAGFRDMLLGL